MPETTPILDLPYPTYTDPADPAAQMQAFAEAVDAELSQTNGIINSYINKRGASISATGTQSIPNTATTTFTFDTVDFDTDNMVDLSADNTVITIQTSGLYFVIASVAYAVNTVNDRQIEVQLQNIAVPEIITAQKTAMVSGNTVRLVIHGMEFLSPGNELRSFAIQNSGAALAVTNRNLQVVAFG